MPEIYWKRMRPRGKKGAIVVLVAALIVIVWGIMNPKVSPEAAKFHWQDVMPGWFGLTLGKFVFYMILIGGLCWTLVIAAVLYDRKKRNVKG